MKYSIAIYRSKHNTLLVIPDGFDEDGVRRQINKYQFIEEPYSADLVGKMVREHFKIAQDEPIKPRQRFVKVYEIATGIRSFAKFSKEWELVVGTLDPENGYTFSYWKRQKNGSYGSNDDPEELKVSLNSLDEEIGSKVLEAFEMV